MPGKEKRKGTSTPLRDMASCIKITSLNYEMGNAISTHQADVIDVYRKLLNKAKVKSRNKKARGIKYLSTIRNNYNDFTVTTRT
jgi:hypothetical protein